MLNPFPLKFTDGGASRSDNEPASATADFNTYIYTHTHQNNLIEYAEKSVLKTILLYNMNNNNMEVKHKPISQMNSKELIDILNNIEEDEFRNIYVEEKFKNDLHNLLYNIILKETDELKITTVVKVVKFPTMIYCLTISPPNNEHCSLLVKLLNGLISCKGCISNFGVFEVSRRNEENFHTHILLQFNNKNNIQNIIKKLKDKKYIFKLDKINNKVQLLKTLRYMLKEDKLNKGIINNNNLEYFYGLCETEQTLISKRCQSTECKCGCVHNIE